MICEHLIKIRNVASLKYLSSYSKYVNHKAYLLRTLNIENLNYHCPYIELR